MARPTSAALVRFLTTLLLVLFPLLAEASPVTLAWSPNSESGIGGYVLYFGTSSGQYGGYLDVGNVTSVQMNTPDSTTRYYFAILAYSTSGLRSALSNEISWTPLQPPSLTNPGSRTTTVGQTVSLQLLATDPAGLSISYGAGGLPQGLSIAPASGLISGTPTTAAVYNVTATATNTASVSATQSFAWTILAPTSGPTLSNPGSRTTTVGQTVSLQLLATDPAGLTISYGAGGLPQGLSIAPASGLISGTPTTAGVYNVTATATNAAGLSATQSFAWTTIQATQTTAPGPSVGDTVAPRIIITSPTSAATYSTSTSSVTLAGTATDNVGVVKLVWKNDRGGQGAAVGTSTWTIPVINLKNGSNQLTVTATDAAGNFATATLTVKSMGPKK
jgi:hypothetical protein